MPSSIPFPARFIIASYLSHIEVNGVFRTGNRFKEWQLSLSVSLKADFITCSRRNKRHPGEEMESVVVLVVVGLGLVVVLVVVFVLVLVVVFEEPVLFDPRLQHDFHRLVRTMQDTGS